nr:PREDICTED: NAD-dependent protein deacetylase Sirt6 [Bemisia tabaci]
MSCNYADGLSPYDNKGKLGLSEEFDSEEEVNRKVDILAEWIQNSNHVVVHTGAGISTSAGIPDFRGPNGVWTLEAKGLKPSINISFDDAVPTKTHMALRKMIDLGKIHFIVSQNIDGLHLKSGVPRKYLSELHGNMFIEQCNHCHRQFVRKTATTSVGQKNLQIKCPGLRLNGRPCRGDLHDVILDWEHNLPEKDLGLADFHSCLADLSICLGTTLQIIPSGTLPLNTKKFNNGRLVICNLQPTKYDKKANLVIHTYVDDIMIKLMKKFNVPIPDYNPELDPTKGSEKSEWTIPESEVKLMRKLYEEKCCKSKRKKIKLEKSKDEDTETVEHKPDIQRENGNFSQLNQRELLDFIKSESKEGLKHESIKLEQTNEQEILEKKLTSIKSEVVTEEGTNDLNVIRDYNNVVSDINNVENRANDNGEKELLNQTECSENFVPELKASDSKSQVVEQNLIVN